MEPLSARTHRVTALEGILLGILLAVLAHQVGQLIAPIVPLNWF